jgi:hypothetical protein
LVCLRLPISNRSRHFCQLVPPTLVEPVARWLDSDIWETVLQPATGLTIPRGDEGETEISSPVTNLDNMSFQECVIRLPVNHYGLVLLKMEESCGPAFLGALETAIPYMSNIAPIMGEVWGGVECWGERADTGTRWRVLPQSGCKEGLELGRVWSELCAEAVEASEVFPVREGGVGCGSVTGETRGRIMEAREKTRAKLLIRALEEFRPQKARPVWSWRQRDKFTAWLPVFHPVQFSL